MTIAKLSYESIKENWEEIKEIVGRSLPVGIDFSVLDFYFKSGQLQLWYLYRDKEVVSITTTFIRKDPFIKQRSLIVYTQYNKGPLINGLYEVWIGGLKKYAKEKDCNAVIRLMVEEVV